MTRPKARQWLLFACGGGAFSRVHIISAADISSKEMNYLTKRQNSQLDFMFIYNEIYPVDNMSRTIIQLNTNRRKPQQNSY